MIKYSSDVSSISSSQINGFFVGWPTPPDEETFLRILQGSYRVIFAIDDGKVVGFINCLSDGILTAYIPLLEVLPEYQGQGIGQELVRRIKEELKDFYMVDLLCDEELIPFYERLGMQKAAGVCLRNYENQSCKKRSQN